MTAVIVAVWIAVSTLVSMDAARRYGYWVGWMIGTLGFGVLALVAYLVFRFTHRPTSEATQ
jgi:hypothetical protein